MFYTSIACLLSMGVGVLAKIAWDASREGGRKYFKTVENRSRRFGEALEYEWLLNTEKGPLAFTEDELRNASGRAEKQKHDLSYTDWE